MRLNATILSALLLLAAALALAGGNEARLAATTPTGTYYWTNTFLAAGLQSVDVAVTNGTSATISIAVQYGGSGPYVFLQAPTVATNSLRWTCDNVPVPMYKGDVLRVVTGITNETSYLWINRLTLE